MDCRNPVYQGYSSTIKLAQHHCTLPHTGHNLLVWVFCALMLVLTGLILYFVGGVGRKDPPNDDDLWYPM